MFRYLVVVAAMAGTVGTVGLMAQPSPAHADPEDAYIAQLQRRGIDYSTPEAAIKLGKATCLALEDGGSAPMTAPKSGWRRRPT